MAYLTPAELQRLASESLLRKLSLDNRTVVDLTAPESHAPEAIADAEAEVDSYIVRRYPEGVPDGSRGLALLKKLTADISIYNLFRRRQVMYDTVRDAYKDAVAHLKRISDNKADLDTGETASTGGRRLPKFGQRKPTFTGADGLLTRY